MSLLHVFSVLGRRPAALIGTIGVIVIGGGASYVFVDAVLSRSDPGVAASAVIVIGSIIVLGTVLVPFVRAVDDPLDPRRFASFGVPARSLAIGIAGAGLVSLPVILGLCLTGVAVFGIATSPAATVAAIVAGILGAASLTLTNRIVVAVASRVIPRRIGSRVPATLLLCALLIVGPALLFMSELRSDAGGEFGAIANGVSWTPFGAVWAIPGDVALGQWGTAAWHVAIQLITIVVLWMSWGAIVVRSTVEVRRDAPARTGAGLGWFEVLPRNEFGAVAARTLKYWTSDRRYWVPITALPLIPLLMVPPLALAGLPIESIALVPLPFISLLIGWQVHNDVALDSSALWLHLTSGVSARADRWGRNVPILLLGSVVVGVGSLATAFVSGQWAMLPAILGASAGLTFAAIGVGAWFAVRHPYPAVVPGHSPFAHPQDSSGVAVRSQVGSLVLSVILGAPSAILMICAFSSGDHDLVWAAMWVGLGTAVLVVIVGTEAAARSLKRRGPELLSALA